MRDLLVTGTDTGVGKTIVTCRLLAQLCQAGINAVGMKPVASGLTQKNGRWVNADVEAIYQETGQDVDRAVMNPYAFKAFIAPHLAARQEGRKIELDRIEDCYQQMRSYADQVVIEGAGGVMTPLNEHQSFIDLAERLSLSVILVVAIRLGCINHARLSAQAVVTAGIPLVGWVANYPGVENERDPDVEGALKLLLPAPCIGVIPYGAQGIKDSKIDIDQILNYKM